MDDRPAASSSVRATPAAEPVPTIIWGAAAVVAGLRALPFLVIALASPSAGKVALLVPYVPRDWLAYAALVRRGPGLLANPFTTDSQDGRIVMLLHQLLGSAHRATGIDPLWLLELSRVPLLALFVLAVWRFSGLVLTARHDRTWGTALVLLSGGVTYLAWAAEPLLPETARFAVQQDLWTAYGWTTFDASFNPLWIAGLTGALGVLAHALSPEGPATVRARAFTGTALIVTWFVHPYSAIAAGAATAGSIASSWISAEPGTWRRASRVGLAFAPAAAVCGAVLLWQRMDPAYASASDGFFGPQAASPAWYPITFGALGFFALRGLRAWASERHPWRHGLGGWVGAIALLHASGLVNGYHFLFALHLPLALLAARPVAAAFAAVHRRRGAPVLAALLAGLLFASPVATTVVDVREAAARAVGEDMAALLARLRELPPSRVLCSPGVGNLVPAFTDHAVYVGHWFLTPDHDLRARQVEALTRDFWRAEELRALVAREGIAHVVVGADRLANVASALGGGTVERFGAFVLVTAPR